MSLSASSGDAQAKPGEGPGTLSQGPMHTTIPESVTRKMDVLCEVKVALVPERKVKLRDKWENPLKWLPHMAHCALGGWGRTSGVPAELLRSQNLLISCFYYLACQAFAQCWCHW